jgi:hypothetical protein
MQASKNLKAFARGERSGELLGQKWEVTPACGEYQDAAIEVAICAEIEAKSIRELVAVVVTLWSSEGAASRAPTTCVHEPYKPARFCFYDAILRTQMRSVAGLPR